MALDIWIVASIMLAMLLVLSVCWGVYREVHFSRVTSKLGRGIATLPRAIQQVEQSLNKMTDQLNRHCDDSRDKHNGLISTISDTKRLVLDVEHRLSEIIRDARAEVGHHAEGRFSHAGKRDQPAVTINTHAYGPQQQNIGQEGGEADVNTKD